MTPQSQLSSQGMAYDPVRQWVIIFGGNSGTGDYDQTWAYSGTRWIHLDLLFQMNCGSSTHPTPRSSPSMAWDGEKIVLFGGDDALPGHLGDTWYLAPNGQGNLCWSQAFPGTVPEGRSRQRMAYNPVTDDIMMFGGSISGAAPTNERWFFGRQIAGGWAQCGTIPNRPCGGLPPARNGVGLAFGDNGGRTVMFGGGAGDQVNYFRDTWTWDTTSGWVCRLVCPISP